MIYVPFHIGDWQSGTRLMSPVEKGVYIDLIMYYYSVERPITQDECKRIARGYANADAQAMQYVLQNHFTREGDSYRHKKCDEVIASGSAISSKRSEAAKIRWGKERARRVAGQAACKNDANANADANANGYAGGYANAMLTSNHKPVTITIKEKIEKKEKTRETAKRLVQSLEKPEGVSDDLWQDWVAHKKRVSKTCTQRMVNSLVREAGLAGMTPAQAMELQLEKGWVGFEASYVLNRNGNSHRSFSLNQDIPFEQRNYEEGINDDHSF